MVVLVKDVIGMCVLMVIGIGVVCMEDLVEYVKVVKVIKVDVIFVGLLLYVLLME